MRFRELSNSAKSSGDQPKLATRASTHLAAHRVDLADHRSIAY